MKESLDVPRKTPHDLFWDKVKSRSQRMRQADLKDSVYSMIKEMILDQDLRPGDQLPVEALAAEMKVSRTPVREALLRLESEGLVHAVSRVGVFVQGISKQDLHELFELREITEGYAAAKSASRMSDNDLDLAGELHRESSRAVDDGDLARFIELETSLHGLILESSGNRRLLQMVASLKDLTHRERVLSTQSLENVKKSVTEHGRIVDALRSRDSRRAEEAMKAHIQAVHERLLDVLDLPESNAEEGRR
jgi:DNA-binding GntR family transcriptional regulator